jgi:hypothetical protein
VRRRACATRASLNLTDALERVKTFAFDAKDVAAITIVYPIDFLPAAWRDVTALAGSSTAVDERAAARAPSSASAPKTLSAIGDNRLASGEPVKRVTRRSYVLSNSLPAIQTKAKPPKGGDAKSPVYGARAP